MMHIINTIIIIAFTALIYVRQPNLKPSDDLLLFVIIFISTLVSVVNVLKLVHRKNESNSSSK